MFNLEVAQSDLCYALKMARITVNKTVCVPLVRIETVEGGIKLSNTDFNSSIVINCPATIRELGVVCLPLLKVCEIIEHLEGNIVLKQENSGVLIIENNKTVFKLAVANDSEFPLIYEYNFSDADKFLCFNKESLLTAVKRVFYATADNGILNGINFTCDNNKIELCATDGNRLAIATTEFEGEKQDDFICSTKLLEVIKGISGENISILIDNSTGNIVLKGDNITFYSKMFVGNYPTYKQLIPQEFSNIVTVDRKNLLNSLLKVIIMTDEKTNIIKLSFSKNELKLSGNREGDSATDIIELTSGLENEFNIAFNYKFLLDCLKVNTCEFIQFGMNSPLSACVVEGDFTTLIMPIQIK